MQFAIHLALLLSLVGSSLAYLVNVPNDNQGWSKYTPGALSWSRVDTDAKGFAVILTNMDHSILPNDIVLSNWVDGTRLSTKIYPPRGGFPTGKHYRVNLVKSTSDRSIFAQSSEFEIKA